MDVKTFMQWKKESAVFVSPTKRSKVNDKESEPAQQKLRMCEYCYDKKIHFMFEKLKAVNPAEEGQPKEVSLKNGMSWMLAVVTGAPRSAGLRLVRNI